MKEKFKRKYGRISNIIKDIAECADKKLILAGGTALALFYLKHRTSIDLDFVPVNGDDERLKQELKGCITKKGYRTSTGVYKNQFVIRFEDTSIKVEIFSPDYKIKKINEFEIEKSKILVASLDDILEMKIDTYKNRKEAKDIFDIIFILKEKKQKFELAKKLIAEYGEPKNREILAMMIENEADFKLFEEVVKNAS